MLSARFPTLQIEIGRQRLRVWQTHGWWRQRHALLLDQTQSVAIDTPLALTSALRAALPAPAKFGTRLRVVLDDGLLRLFMVTPPTNARSLADCRSAAAARFLRLYGSAPDGWHLSADWQARQPFLCCALPADWLAALTEATAGAGTLIDVTSQLIERWNRQRRRLLPDAWLASIGETSVTLAVLENGRLQAVQVLACSVDDVADAQWLSMVIARQALGLGVALPEVVQVIGEMANAWSNRSTKNSNYQFLPNHFIDLPKL